MVVKLETLNQCGVNQFIGGWKEEQAFLEILGPIYEFNIWSNPWLYI